MVKFAFNDTTKMQKQLGNIHCHFIVGLCWHSPAVMTGIRFGEKTCDYLHHVVIDQPRRPTLFLFIALMCVCVCDFQPLHELDIGFSLGKIASMRIVDMQWPLL